MKWKPKPYQRRIVEHILKHPAAAVWARVGSGKTSATLAALAVMKQKAGFRALVVAPLQVALNVWGQEAEKWNEFTGLRVAVLHGPKKLHALASHADVYVINYDGLAWLERVAPRDWWPEVLVLDESSKCRNTDTKRFKTLRAIAARAKRRIALSGTPRPNGAMNLFGQYRLLDAGARLGRFITHFRTQFCYPTGFGGYDWALLPGAEEQILERVRDITIEVSAGDLGSQLPKLVVNDVHVSLPAECAAAYHKLERDLVVQLKSAKRITAVNALSLTAKLRQFLSGAVYTDHPDWEHVHDARLDALDAVYEECSGPLLVFYEFEHEAERIWKRFNDAVKFTAASPRERVKIVERWNAGEIPMLLAHPASAGHGLNLQAGSNEMLWFSMLYDLELYQQSIGRLVRTGQKAPQVFCHRLVTPGSLDDVMCAALERKDAGQEEFLAGLRERYLGAKLPRAS